MPPILFLALMILLTALAWAAHLIVRHTAASRLRQLATDWHMRYAQQDLFNLSRRIVPVFPIPAVADIRVGDLIYGSHAECHRYVFTVEYTLGPVDRYRRERRVATFCEAIETGPDKAPSPIVLASEELPVLEQYRQLHRDNWRPQSSPEII